MQIPENYLNVYRDNVLRIDECSKAIVENISKLLEDKNISHIDRIYGRAKSVERFMQKAQKKTDEGLFRYKQPLMQIQDQIGVRIITFYLSDVKKITNIIKEYFESIEIVDKHPENYDVFSYVGQHFILFIPDEIKTYNEGEYLPSFFELQIKTMFQHAWAESNHDLNYKTKNELSFEDKRLIAYSAAQAWGADIVFEELSNKYLSKNNSVIIPFPS